MCSAAAQHSQQERARAQVKAEEAAAAWHSAFSAEGAAQEQQGSDQAGASGSCEPSLLDLGVDIDDPLQVQLARVQGARIYDIGRGVGSG